MRKDVGEGENGGDVEGRNSNSQDKLSNILGVQDLSSIHQQALHLDRNQCGASRGLLPRSTEDFDHEELSSFTSEDGSRGRPQS